MRRFVVAFAVVAFASCGADNSKPANSVSKEPVSVRGWIEDVAGSAKAATPEMETARRQQIFQATQIWVEHADYVSGGVAENGSFILLDVPPGNVTIGFSAPGADRARVVLQNIPGNADVFLPGLILKAGGASFSKPEDLRVRIAGDVKQATPTGKTAMLAGTPVPILNVPLASLVDRHDFPRPTGFQPVATYK